MSEQSRAMTGKICMITGSNAGIGEETARVLAGRGATVVVVGRSAERCAAAAEAIRRSTGHSAVEFLVADLSTSRGIRGLAEQFQTRHPRLDVLVNNAGAMFAARQENSDGIEMTFALNHLAYFLLTNLLLDSLRAAPRARIVNVASDAHRMVRGLNFDDLQNRNRYQGFRVYSQSKLANILFTYELARRLEGTNITANALHPGFVATSFFEGNGLSGLLMRVGATLFAIPKEKGARTSIHLASSPEVEGVSGGYFERERPAKSSRATYDDAAARRLWQISEELTGGSEVP